ncbi:MAG: uracil-DNA glycosylase [Leptothrix ochracea]|uniref:uracil-DNA glycosylase n=1 Tax=Leptothrix ochracea TaxID=735331 RepID=UPI0034E1BD39
MSAAETALLPDNRLARPLAEALLCDVAPGWGEVIEAFLASPKGRSLGQAVDARVAQGVPVYPAWPLRALTTLSPADVRVVILGQDPYHGPDEAEGLAFSVPEGIKIPPSLRNIRQELVADVGLALPGSGSLRPWCRQGVLLLNTCLSVEKDRPASHAKWGWEALTDALIDLVAAQAQPKVFLLWGAHAQAKAERLKASRQPQRILMSNHPSPLSARRPPVPFLGSRPFSQADRWLREQSHLGIDWALT